MRREERWLRIILATYILLCLLIAGVNFGYAPKAPPEIAKLIEWGWHFYENWIKTIFILISAYLTIQLTKTSKLSSLRKSNLIGLSVTALVLHILLPLLLRNPELYLFSMPLPWNSAPLQLLVRDSGLYLDKAAKWGVTALPVVTLYHFALSALVFVGTLLYGRRWQCSTLCMFNGFASEVFAPAIPLVGRTRPPRKWLLTLFTILRWAMFAVAIGLTLLWLSVMLRIFPATHPILSVIAQGEVYKYLLLELLLMMLFWVIFRGRGYCYYCPLGTLLALIGRVIGQSIQTTRSNCIQCGKCNQTCPMAIDILKQAKNKRPVTDLRCVGCGHCIDVCPTSTLWYTTRFFPLKK